MKRISALHFAILGHEIGHLLYKKWKQKTSFDFFEEKTIRKKVEEYIEDIITKEKNEYQIRVFEDERRAHLISHFSDSLKRCFEEFCCDIFGILIFGFSFILSHYKFGSLLYPQGKNIITVDEGYYPWDYRLKICLETMYNLPEIYQGSELHEVNAWLRSLNNQYSNIDINYIFNNKMYGYHKIFIEEFEIYLPTLITELHLVTDELLYENIADINDINLVTEYLNNKIVPAVRIDEKLESYPLDFRNIISGTWNHILSSSIDFNNTELLYNLMNQANLLSLKGIELSKITAKFKSGTV
ncbi:MAG: hypothetical protein ABIA75_09680 [Candidatus Neomarinimicrobiota bacterium]